MEFVWIHTSATKHSLNSHIYTHNHLHLSFRNTHCHRQALYCACVTITPRDETLMIILILRATFPLVATVHWYTYIDMNYSVSMNLNVQSVCFHTYR